MFSSFISLGSACDVASSMSKYGFRSFSGPFDWLLSPLESVIYFMDTDFIDFMNKKNLQINPDRQHAFTDFKYGIEFFHEVIESFDIEYDEIFKKYKRRIERFKHEVKKGVCFIRKVRNNDEMLYIIENEEKIRRIIKKENSNNEIIFLVTSDKEIPNKFPFKMYSLMIDKYNGSSREDLRNILDKNKKFLSYCLENMKEDTIKDNLIFDLRKELSIAESRYKLTYKILNTDFSTVNMPREVIIYGAGNIGKLLYDKINEHCKIECFWDIRSIENSYKGTAIINPRKIKNIVKKIIIVTVVNEYEQIKTSLSSVSTPELIISINDILSNNL